jgi:serine/threonine-protein kinase
MGEVYKAFDLILNQTVALKFLSPSRVSEAALVRFRNEVRIARQVSHPNVCRVYDLGMAEGLHFLSMEYIGGEDLASLLRRIGRLPQDKAIEFTRKICAGLSAAHERGVLHRDLKPGNVMIDGRGQVRITDFGLAGLAAEIPLSDLRSGTPAYMSPEQKAGREVTTRSDIYSLGLVLHEMFTGKARKDTQSSPSELVKDLDPGTERLILRCLEEDPKRRPSSALNVAMALPGADPIAAALAAGETPSPEMVAASHEKEGFTSRTALLCLAGIVAAMIAGIALQAKIGVLARAPVTIRPDALADRVQQLLRSIGYPGEQAQVDYGYYCCNPVTESYLRGLDAAKQAQALMSHRPALMSLFYSQYDAAPAATSPFQVGDPPPPGLIRVQVDARGRLLHLQAQPRSEASDVKAPDWAMLFSAAGLDLNRFTPATPQDIPEVAADTQAAWEGDFGGGLAHVRVEAASWRGRPVEFSVALANPPPFETAPIMAFIGVATFPVLIAILFAGALIVAWRNLRQGRGDKRGVYVILVTIVILSAANTVLQPRHVTFPGFPWALAAVVVGVGYIAAEPYVRRHWPDSLISWSRLCSGKLRNPLVASHVLAGLAVAEIWGAVISPATDALAGYGNLPGVAVLGGSAIAYLGGAGDLIAHWSPYARQGLIEAVLLLIAIVLLRLAIRKLWAADLAAAILIALLVGGPRPQAVVLLPAWLGFMWLLRNFGLLSYFVVYMVQITLVFTPLGVADWARMRFLPVHLVPVLLGLWAVWVIFSAQKHPGAESAG